MTISRLAALSLLMLGCSMGDNADTCDVNDGTCDSGLVMLQAKVEKQKGVALAAADEETATYKNSAGYKNLAKLFDDVKEGRRTSLSTKEILPHLHEIAADSINGTMADAESVAFGLDLNNDGILDTAELDKYMNPTIDDDLSDNEGSATEPVLLEGGGNKTTGDWITVSFSEGNNDWSPKMYNEPRYFKPRVMMGNDLNFNACAITCLYLPNGPGYGYIYTNALHKSSKQGLCRCYPKDSSAWHANGHPAWSWYSSGSGNHIYCPQCR